MEDGSAAVGGGDVAGRFGQGDARGEKFLIVGGHYFADGRLSPS